jgi:hypothetical protein
VQVIRGKQLIGEIAIAPRSITYVQSEARAEEEFLFECVEESDTGVFVAYHFTLSHDYSTEEEAPPQRGRWLH